MNYGKGRAARGVTRSQHNFAQVPSAQIPRSVFNRSCGLKTEFSSGYLVPVFVDEALPGDTMSMKMASFIRAATPLYPVLDNAYLDFFFFAVPNRLLWSNWEKFNGAQEDPGDSTDFLVPIMTETVAEQSLSDYLGIPPGIADLQFSSMWHRAYNAIFNSWFRDENLQDSAVVDLDDGPDTPGDYVLRRRGKRHDYFTSCLPFRQKGTEVQSPLGATAPVVSAGTGIPEFTAGALTDTVTVADGSPNELRFDSDPTGDQPLEWSDPMLETDLSAATAASINEIREAFQIQKLLERDARGGSRYTEIVRSHFGVVSPDQRLQRPEYLGGGSVPINIQAVPSTYRDQGNGQLLGDLGGFGLAQASGVGFFKSFVEHCVVIGLVNVRAELTYQQGLDRMFSRRTRFDFYWPAFAHLGEQAVLNKEIYAQGDANDDLVFGYQERWAEYRYKPSRTSGRMRSQAGTPLDAWHYGLEFSALPVLNDVFIEDDPPIERTQVFGTATQYFGDFYFEFKCARPMPTFSVPGLVDHF